MHPNRVREAFYYLGMTESFLSETMFSKDSVLTLHKEFIEEVLRSRPDDIALGVYVNNIELLDCLIITNNGIFSIYKTKGRYIPFKSVQKASTPMKGDHEIDVELVDNEFETISVQGETNGIPDIYAFEQFLKYLCKSANTDVFEDLKSVESKDELVALMDKHFGRRSGRETEGRIENFEDEFKAYNIGADIKEAKGFWRFVGLWRIDDALLNDSDEEH